MQAYRRIWGKSQLRPGKPLLLLKKTWHQVLFNIYCSCWRHYILYKQRKKCYWTLLDLLCLLFKQYPLLHEASCLCNCSFRTSVHSQVSIVYPDKQYLGVSGRVPRWCGDKGIMLWQLCLYYRLAHIAEGCCSAVPFFTHLRWSKGIVPVSWMKRMVLGICCGNKL